ncbi:MAG: hypothetical protein JWN92_1493 [Candidatus Acidoferrum typicum]|nr:hypothetical protein [Candidatus Acidoferrum typicum]
MLIRGFASVGIIALVDEATGYQYERPRRDLEEYLTNGAVSVAVRAINCFSGRVKNWENRSCCFTWEPSLDL